MYCKKCGRQLENDAVFCSACGERTNQTTEYEASTPLRATDEHKIETVAKVEESLPAPQPESEKKTKKKLIISSVILLSILLSILLPIVIKYSRVNEIPNYYFDFGSIGYSYPSGEPENKTFCVDVTLVSDVKAYDLEIEVYVYSANELVTKFKSKTDTALRGRNTTKITIDFPDKSLINTGKYDYCFTATAKTHDKLPSIEYGTVTFLNYDNSVFETVIVEKRAGDTPIYPIPKRSGYTFDGWYYDPYFKQEFEMGEQHVYKEEYEDVVLYPKWVKN